MAIRTTFAPLFQLRFLHDAKLDLGASEWSALSTSLRDQRSKGYDLSDDLLIKPSPDCQHLMSQQGMRVRQEPFGLTVYAQVVEDPNDPASMILARPLEDDARFRFSLELTNPAFPTAANLPLNQSANKALYLSNSHQHSEAGELHLTREIPAFDAAQSYPAGTLVVDDDANPTILLEATEDLAPTAIPGDSDWLHLPESPFAAGTDYTIEDQVMHEGILYEAAGSGTHAAPPSAEWSQIDEPSLRTGVTQADFVTVRNHRPTFQLPLGLKFVKAKLFDSADQEIKSFTFFHDSGDDLTDLSFDLSEFPHGFYRIEAVDFSEAPLPGFPQVFYLDSKRPFGLIEIFNQDGTHAIIDANGHLPAPIFHVRFRKRHTFWRYHFSGDLKAFPPADTGDLRQVDPADNSIFVSQKPLPLTTGSISLQKFGEGLKLPNADLNTVKPEEGKLYSDLFINI